MEVWVVNIKKIPLSFFERSRPDTSKNSLKNIQPFKWTNENEIINQKKKDQVIIKLSKN